MVPKFAYAKPTTHKYVKTVALHKFNEASLRAADCQAAYLAGTNQLMCQHALFPYKNEIKE